MTLLQYGSTGVAYSAISHLPKGTTDNAVDIIENNQQLLWQVDPALGGGATDATGQIVGAAGALAGGAGLAADGVTGILEALSTGEVTSTGVDATASEGTAARGLRNLGGIFSSSENAAGGTVYLSDGAINQNQVADIVDSEIYNPGEINIISGVHGTPEGGTEIDTQMFNEDVARFGNIPGVNVFNYGSFEF